MKTTFRISPATDAAEWDRMWAEAWVNAGFPAGEEITYVGTFWCPNTGAGVGRFAHLFLHANRRGPSSSCVIAPVGWTIPEGASRFGGRGPSDPLDAS